MLTSELDYDLPASAIAQEPVEPRDSARLLVAGPPEAPIAHRRVSDLPDLLSPGDILVVNDTRVIPARIRTHKATGGAVEVLLLSRRGDGDWESLVKPSRRVPPGTRLVVDMERDGVGTAAGTGQGEVAIEVGEILGDDGRRRVRFIHDGGAAVLGALDAGDAGAAGVTGTAGDRDDLDVIGVVGEIPLPPYIHVPLADADRYQTVFAATPGSVAAPTAGLHLTEAVLQRCRAMGVEILTLDLVVGLGTFRPVSAERVEDHPMHAERYRIPPATAERLAARRLGPDAENEGRVVAVGTTVVRALESWAQTGQLEADTSLFIRRGHNFAVVDRLLTNFHVPRSSLLALVDAFVGPRWRSLYEAALDEGYRMLSFGDAMLLDRDDAVAVP